MQFIEHRSESRSYITRVRELMLGHRSRHCRKAESLSHSYAVMRTCHVRGISESEFALQAE